MKLTTITHMLAVAAAAGFCMSVAAGGGQGDNLVLNGYVEQFKVTTSNPVPVGGAWNDNTPPEIENSKFVIDTTPSTSNEFNYAETTDKMVQCDFNLAVAPVRAPLPPQSSVTQAAFCISTNAVDGGPSTFCAYVNGKWEPLAGVDVPPYNEFYDLRMTFDYQNGRYVKFSIKTAGGEYTDLCSAADSSVKWFATGFGEQTTGVKRYCFVGTGDVSSFSTAQSSIKAESVEVDGIGNVTIPEDVITLIDVPSGKTLSEVLAEKDAAGDNKVIDNIVLGLRTSEGLKDGGNLIASSADAGSGDATKIKLGLNIDPPAGTGATVSYRLYGSNDGAFNGEETAVGEPTNDSGDLAIPLSGTIYKYYKVKATITYGEAD